ncbi:MAG: DUF3817 domain-containing protein [Bowdeniella nasicola]|nr:DUF3817 domain-containing protein [Bowdeniella nasicola]
MSDVEVKARKALKLYQILATITGIMLLCLVAEMVMKYGFQLNGADDPTNWTTARPVIGSWVAIIHGWIYVVYLVTVFNLWSTMRWGFGRLLVMVIAGVIPVMSFIVEARASRWVHNDLPAAIAKARAAETLPEES